MDRSECTWCAAEIDGGGVDHKGLLFCSDVCVEEWNEDSLDVADLDLDELDAGLPLLDEFSEFNAVLPVDEDATY
jgi:hypothetical protein